MFNVLHFFLNAQCGNSSAQEQGHQLEEKDEGVEKEEEEAERRKQRELEEEQRARDERQKDVLQQLAAEKVEKQRVALVQLQVNTFRFVCLPEWRTRK